VGTILAKEIVYDFNSNVQLGQNPNIRIW